MFRLDVSSSSLPTAVTCGSTLILPRRAADAADMASQLLVSVANAGLISDSNVLDESLTTRLHEPAGAPAGGAAAEGSPPLRPLFEDAQVAEAPSLAEMQRRLFGEDADSPETSPDRSPPRARRVPQEGVRGGRMDIRAPPDEDGFPTHHALPGGLRGPADEREEQLMIARAIEESLRGPQPADGR